MPRLLALDLDGTLLRRDGTLDPRDVAAIRAARKAGITVTLATGRLTTGTLPTARALELDGLLVCGDGATIADAETGDVVERTPLPVADVDTLLHALASNACVPYVFSHGAIHAEESGRVHGPYVKIWTEHIHYHPSLRETDAWRGEGEATMTVGIGDSASVAAAEKAIEGAFGERVTATHFVSGGHHVIRSFRRECSKGNALRSVAARLGIPHDEIAVVGDWYNDLSMFALAKRSFAMGGAPEPVARAATDRLKATAGEGGGVAEAIARWT